MSETFVTRKKKKLAQNNILYTSLLGILEDNLIHYKANRLKPADGPKSHKQII